MGFANEHSAWKGVAYDSQTVKLIMSGRMKGKCINSCALIQERHKRSAFIIEDKKTTRNTSTEVSDKVCSTKTMMNN